MCSDCDGVPKADYDMRVAKAFSLHIDIQESEIKNHKAKVKKSESK